MVFGLCSSGSVYLLSCSCSARFFVLFLSALVLNGIEWDLCAEVRSEVTAKPRSGSTLVNDGAGGMFGEGRRAAVGRVGVLRSALHLPGSRRLLISASGIGSLPFARIAQTDVVRAGNGRAETVVDHATAQKPHCGAA